ncbi:ParB/RepB/Spo0J family partition protein [Oryzobacter sp. R7]|uniref:ParB/RepB/Spo0J family partition protein n=1 Tax=Oryzobacter faecalis TaxID=3388656 RepID=UPI00398D28F7
MTAAVKQPTLATSQLAAHPNNPRRAVGNVDDIVASAKQLGILEPLVVAPPPTDGWDKVKADYVVLCGNRRFAAAKKARLKEVPVVIRADATTLAAQLEIMLVENLHRADLTPVEEGDAYQQVMDLEGLTQKALADKIGQPRARISERVRLARTPDAVRDAAHSGQISIADALAVAEFRGDPEVEKQLLDAIGTDELSFALNRARRDRDQVKARKERAAEILEQGGPKVLDEPTDGAIALGNLWLDGAWGDTWNVEQEKAQHAGCAGRTAWWSHGTTPAFGCTEPALHERPAVRPKDPVVDELAVEREKAQSERTANLAAAADTRREFVNELLAKGIGLTDALVRARLVELVIEASRLEDRFERDLEAGKLLMHWFGVPKKRIEDLDSAQAMADEIRSRLADCTKLPYLVACLDVAWHVHLERSMAVSTSVDEWERPWLDALNTYGYRWSDFERETYRFALTDEDGDATGRTWTVDGIVGQPDDSGDGEDGEGS